MAAVLVFNYYFATGCTALHCSSVNHNKEKIGEGWKGVQSVSGEVELCTTTTSNTTTTIQHHQHPSPPATHFPSQFSPARQGVEISQAGRVPPPPPTSPSMVRTQSDGVKVVYWLLVQH